MYNITVSYVQCKTLKSVSSGTIQNSHLSSYLHTILNHCQSVAQRMWNKIFKTVSDGLLSELKT